MRVLLSLIKRVSLNVVVLFTSGILCIFILECLVRVLFPVYNPSGMVEFYYDENGVLLGKKNSGAHQWMKAGDFDIQVRFNQYGFRDTKDLQMSTTHDFFVVGDSFSFGHGVAEDKRYSNILESLLGVLVYNISIPTDFDGYEKLIKYAQQQGATIKNLIIGVCMENDLKNYANPESEQNRTLPTSSQSKPETSPYYNKIKAGKFLRIKIFLGKQSALYNMLISLFHQNRMLKDLASKFGIMDQYADGINRFAYSEAVLRQTSQRLVRLQTDCQIPNVMIVVIPSRALWIGDNRECEFQAHTEFVTILRAAHFNVVDLRSVFEADGNPFQYHFQHDGHWNQQGHHKAAEAIARQIKTGHTQEMVFRMPEKDLDTP
jgi:hypothetical protein